MTVHAIFENGVFRPTHPVDLPEGTLVKFDLKIVEVDNHGTDEAMQAVYEIMSHRFRSEKGDLSANHNEHQP